MGDRENLDAVVAMPVVMAAANAFDLPYGVVMSGAATQEISHCRFAAMLALHRAKWSYPRIARAVGRVNHTTALHGVRRALDLERTQPLFEIAVRRASDVIKTDRYFR